MSFQPPKDLAPFEVLFDYSEANPALPPTLVAFAGNIGFSPPPPQRPWVFANFVQSLDGLVSFGGTRPGGEWISGHCPHDRWMMDLLRAHADAVLCGAGTLRSEALHGPIPRGPVYRIVDGSLLALRQKTFQLPALKIIVVSGSGRLRPADYRLFQSEHVEAWIATTPDGHHRIGDTDYSRVLVSGSGGRVDWEELLHRLRAELFVRHLLCEGGPTLYGDLARAGFVDEKFLTISPQEVGAGLPIDETPSGRVPNADKMLRPTGLAGPGFSVETALWYRWISCRRAGDHEFNRYRRVAPRPR